MWNELSINCKSRREKFLRVDGAQDVGKIDSSGEFRLLT